MLYYNAITKPGCALLRSFSYRYRLKNALDVLDMLDITKKYYIYPY